MSFPQIRSLVLCVALSGLAAMPVLVQAQATQATPTTGAQDSSAPVTAKGQEDALKNEEKANKDRAKAAKAQRKALRAQEKAAKAEQKAGTRPGSTTPPQ